MSRSPRQVQLRRLLRGCEVVALDEPTAHIARLATAAGARLVIIEARGVADVDVAA